MDVPKPIAVFGITGLNPYRVGYFQITPDIYHDRSSIFLMDNGTLIDRGVVSDKHFSEWEASDVVNSGPVHPDDWTWCEDRMKMCKVSDLTDDEIFTALNTVQRVKISEYTVDPSLPLETVDIILRDPYDPMKRLFLMRRSTRTPVREY